MNLYGEDLTVNNDEHIVLEGDLSSVGISESQGGPRYSTLFDYQILRLRTYLTKYYKKNGT